MSNFLSIRSTTNMLQCDREWFHLDCVGLTEVPSRTAKWYCPQCRVKLHKGEDGIIKGGSRR